MPDQKLTQLTELTTVNNDDMLYVVRPGDGSTGSRKAKPTALPRQFSLRRAPTDGYFYLVVAGQSNAQGLAGSGEGEQDIDANIQIWSTAGSAWITPVIGSHPLASGGSINVGVWIANYLQRSGVLPSGTVVRILPNWLGGEPIEGWMGTGTSSPRWQELLTALSASGCPRIDHLVWWQGEANSAAGTGTAKTLSAYSTAWNTLVAQWRALSQWTPTTGITVSMLGPWGNTGNNDRNDFWYFLQSGNTDPYIDVISAAGCTPTSVGNDGAGNNPHFDGPSIQRMARRHFDSMLLMMNGGGAKRSSISSANGSPWRWRQRIDVTGTYRVTSDDLANENILTVTGNVTITLPELGRNEYSGAVIIDNRSASLFNVTLAAGASSIEHGNNISTGSALLYQGFRNVYRVEAHSGAWRVLQQWQLVGQIRKFLATITGDASISEASSANTIHDITAAAQLTLPQPNFTLTGALIRFVNNVSNWATNQTVALLANLTGTTPVRLASARCKVINRGTGYVPNEVITIAGGTGTPGTLTVATTTVVSATVATGGSGGTNGTQTVTGTTGTGTRFTASVTVSGGAITAVQSITSGGSYTVNPTTLTAEPVTGASLTGAQLNVVMGVGTLSAATFTGSYTVLPPQPGTQASTSGSGTGATFALGFINAIRGLNPRLYQLSRPIGKPGDQVIWERSPNSNDILHDSSREGATHRLVAGTLSTQTMAADDMLQQRSYRVATGAAITLPLAALCEEGSTIFWSTGSWTLAVQSGDAIIGGNVNTTSSIDIAANSAICVHAQEAGTWVVLPAPTFATPRTPNSLDNGGFEEAQRGTSRTITGSTSIENRGWGLDRWYTQWPTTTITLSQVASESLSGNRPVLASHCTRIALQTSNGQYNLFQVLPLDRSVALRGSRVSGQIEFRWTHATPASNTLRPTIAILAFNGTANDALRLRPYTANSPWTLRSGFTELASAQLPTASPGDGVWRQISVQTSANVPDDTTHLILMYRQTESGHLTTGTLEIAKAGLYPATQAQLWLPEARSVTADQCRRHYEEITFDYRMAHIYATTTRAITSIPMASQKRGAAATPAVSVSSTGHWQINSPSDVGVAGFSIVSSSANDTELRLMLQTDDPIGTTGQGCYLVRTNTAGRFIVNAENDA